MAKACHQFRQCGTRGDSQHRTAVPQTVETQVWPIGGIAGFVELPVEGRWCQVSAMDGWEQQHVRLRADVGG